MKDLINSLTNVVVARRALAIYNYELSVTQQSWGSQHRGGSTIHESRHIYCQQADSNRWDAGFWGDSPFQQTHD